MSGWDRSEGISPGRAITMSVGAVALVALAAIGLYAYQWTDAARKLPQADADLEVVEAESITDFVPAGASLASSGGAAATQALFFGTESVSAVVRTFTTDDVGATMVAFLQPATADGWRLVSVSCRRVLDTSEMHYTKNAPRHDGTVATLDLKISYDQLSGRVVAATSVPRPARNTPTRSVDELLYTGVSRTDPGCLRDRREPSSTVAPAAPWTSEQTCAVIAEAWPNTVVEATTSEYCLVGGGYTLTVKAVASTDPYDYEDDRLSTAGGPTMFATIDGGFWVARPDGVAIYAVSPNAAIGRVPPEDELLRAAALLAEAPGPT